ncbi:MAG: PIN domain-containing protein [Mucilaginibacter sp.]
MNDKIFLDTNIFIYAHTDLDLSKQNKAQLIIRERNIIISTQVLQETANILNKKLKQSWPDIGKVLSELSSNASVYINNETTIIKACLIADRYKFSFYDCLIISAAIESDATILYSEDMQHNQLIENQLRIINPFI